MEADLGAVANKVFSELGMALFVVGAYYLGKYFAKDAPEQTRWFVRQYASVLGTVFVFAAARPANPSNVSAISRCAPRSTNMLCSNRRRAGIEGTISQRIRRCGLRRSRYVGLARTHLGHVLAAAALNVARVADWLAEAPRARTRPSPFALLMATR